MQHLPFIDNLWFGENFNVGPSVTKEHWLIEQSGMLWGQFSETLSGGWIPHKGMLFGETGRAPAANMIGMYAFWDAVNISEMEMCGWWNTTAQGCPARTTNSGVVPLTSYWCGSCGAGGKPAAVLAMASFAHLPVNVSLEVDWARMGFAAATVKLSAPAISGVQANVTIAVGQEIAVPAQLGWLIAVNGPECM